MLKKAKNQQFKLHPPYLNNNIKNSKISLKFKKQNLTYMYTNTKNLKYTLNYCLCFGCMISISINHN